MEIDKQPARLLLVKPVQEVTAVEFDNTRRNLSNMTVATQTPAVKMNKRKAKQFTKAGQAEMTYQQRRLHIKLYKDAIKQQK